MLRAMTYAIRTPENVTFEYELAGVAARAVALLIDLVVMFALGATAMLVIAQLGPALGGFATALGWVAGFVIQFGYPAILEWAFDGRTAGKWVVGIRVLSDDGLRIDFVQSVIRNLVRILDMLPLMYLVGGTAALIDGDRRRLGDIAAGTIVVKVRRTHLPSAVVPPSARDNCFVDDPSVAHAARRITAPERDAMVKLTLRRDELPLALRRDLFRDLAEHLEARLALERPSFFSEEKFVLNLTAVALADRSVQSGPPGPSISGGTKKNTRRVSSGEPSP